MRAITILSVLTILLSQGCQSITRIPLDPTDSLGIAKELTDSEDYYGALETLEYFGPDPLSVEDRAYWHLLGGTALLRAGEPWEAFALIRGFLDEGRFLLRTAELANLTYEIGEQLATSDGSFWVFQSDRTEGATVLKVFVSLYPRHKNMPDALHRLGEIAFEDGNYEVARERYTQIITDGYDTFWSPKAAFRVAMCYFHRLEGPEYDLAEMEKAQVELTDFLSSTVDDLGFRREADSALRTVKSWLAQKYVSIAEFYFEVDNDRGGIENLRRAWQGYPETNAGAEAGQRLVEMGQDRSGGVDR